MTGCRTEEGVDRGQAVSKLHGLARHYRMVEHLQLELLGERGCDLCLLPVPHLPLKLLLMSLLLPAADLVVDHFPVRFGPGEILVQE